MIGVSPIIQSITYAIEKQVSILSFLYNNKKKEENLFFR
jgi:cytochrome c oxidase subunit 1